jgi:lipopolysaccharide export system permease protein
MRLLDRYLLRELLVPLGYCLAGFLLFWVVFDLFAQLNEFQRNSLRPAEIVEYYLVIAPEFLVMVLPMTLLLALLYTLTNLARHHEITAIRAAGISLWRLSLPYFAVGFLLSVACFAANELWVPESSTAAEFILTRHVDSRAGRLARGKVSQLPFTNARDGRTWHISVYDLTTGEMNTPQVLWTESDGSRMWLQAERAVYKDEVWHFINATIFRAAPETNSVPLPVLQTNLLTRPDFNETPDLIRSEIQISNRLLVGRAKKADIPINEILNYFRLHPNPSDTDRFWLQTKLHGRLAAPWTCLVVVLIALPFGAASGRRNVFVGVASSILISFIYFVLQQLTLALGSGGHLPPWLAAWLPNICFGLVGIWMTARVR